RDWSSDVCSSDLLTASTTKDSDLRSFQPPAPTVPAPDPTIYQTLLGCAGAGQRGQSGLPAFEPASFSQVGRLSFHQSHYPELALTVVTNDDLTAGINRRKRARHAFNILDQLFESLFIVLIVPHSNPLRCRMITTVSSVVTPCLPNFIVTRLGLKSVCAE